MSSILDGLPEIARAKGSYVYDTAGHRYIDGVCGPAVFCIGHGNEEVAAAIKAELLNLAFVARHDVPSASLQELRQIVRARCGMHEVVFVTGGSEAIEACLLIALQYQAARGKPGKRCFIARDRSQHGDTLGALSISGEMPAPMDRSASLLETRFVTTPNPYRLPRGIEADRLVDYCLDELESTVLEVGAETTCAVVLEPVSGLVTGALSAPPDYVRRVKALCERYEMLLIADERTCGVGRTGTWRALEQDGVVPDLMALGEALCGGYLPLGAAAIAGHVLHTIDARFDTLVARRPFVGHASACGAGVAVQRIIDREGLLRKVQNDSRYLFGALESSLKVDERVGDIRGRGFYIGIELVSEPHSRVPFDPELRVHERVRERALVNRLICHTVAARPDGSAGDHIVLSPPFNATRAELDEIVDKLGHTVRWVLRTLHS